MKKERMARRLEGIESDAPPVLLPGGLVANRMLEEDPHRYTRASDPCDPLRRLSREELDAPQKPVTSPQCQSRAGVSPSTPSDAADLRSKAERIARYKAERRKQLSERYGILLDQEADIDYASRYRVRLDQDSAADRHSAGRRDRPETEPTEDETGGPYRSGVGRVYMRTHPDLASAIPPGPISTNQASAPTQDSRFLEQERAMNIENYRRGGAEECTSGIRAQEHHVPLPQHHHNQQQQQQQQNPTHHHHIDATHKEQSPNSSRESSVTAVPGSPRTARRASLPSTRYGISPGDLFIEQQAQSILNRQG
uniref:Supervillin a n=1 Tax=Hippocampus comes TaxID=109280 RepID=A0A3Q2YYM3_HIPCM